MNLKEILLSTMVGALEELGEQKLEEDMQKLHDNNPVLYPTVLKAGLVFCDGIQPCVDKSKSKIDDAVIAGIRQAIIDSAATNGVDLSIGDSSSN